MRRNLPCASVRSTRLWILVAALVLLTTARATPISGPDGAGVGPTTPYPILFVTQVPLPQDFGTVNATFANHRADVGGSNRGGDLWIRYPNGGLKNLTLAAGFGNAGFQGLTSIAVRDPAVHWDGARAVFAMAVGSVEQQYQLAEWRWQLYEIAGLGLADTPVITKVANQPATYNNIMPVYAADDRILFVSDRPRNGAAHLYPLLDEYERTPSNSGLWSLDPTTGDLRHLDHAPSGDFHPLVDSFGRVVFTRWDHLERDQLADADAGPVSSCYQGSYYGSVNYTDESAGAPWGSADLTEHFPEPRRCRNDLLAGTFLDGHPFNHFFPWMINQDGSGLETLNHIGRQELHGYLPRTFNNDPNIVEYYGQYPRANPRSILNLFQIDENPSAPGFYLGIFAPEFGTHASGQLVELKSSPSDNPDDITVTYVTHPVTASTAENPPPEHIGLSRDPLRLGDGTLVVAHTFETRQDRNTGSTGVPKSLYNYRLKTLVPGPGGYRVPGANLTPGISKSVTWWNPDTMVSYDGPLWELNPVEVRPRPRVSSSEPALSPPEAQAFAAAGVDPLAFRSYLVANDLALIVSRNVTTRDDFDLQQPRNLRVPGGVESLAGPGTVYDVDYIQFFQGDHLRGDKGCCASTPRPGRRVLAQPLHDPTALACNPSSATGPAGSKDIAADGSMAAIVPARRALTWQLTDPAHTGVVRERYWLTFQPGEIRVCASCHGVNRHDQAGQPPPENQPQALVRLLQSWSACQTAAKPVLVAVSTRGRVGTGDQVLIAGTVIHGTGKKRVLIRALGPTLTGFGVAGTLANPTLELRSLAGNLLATNDDWKTGRTAQEIQAIVDTGLAPPSDQEPCILTELDPGPYTPIVRGVSGGTGVALVEIYDLASGNAAKLVAVSTRGFVGTGDNVLIGGTAIHGLGKRKLLIRALGPTLTGFGVAGVLGNPTIELRTVGGQLLAANDDWRSGRTAADQQAIRNTGFAPQSDLEPAILIELNPGAYTPIVTGAGGTTGVGIVEIYEVK